MTSHQVKPRLKQINTSKGGEGANQGWPERPRPRAVPVGITATLQPVTRELRGLCSQRAKPRRQGLSKAT